MSNEAERKILLNIDVPDLERAKAFYTQGLGLHVGRSWDGFVELLGAETPLYLLEKKAGTAPHEGAHVGRTYERHWTPVHLDFIVPELETAIRRATAAGATLEGGPAKEPYGTIAYLADPFGHGLCLIAFSEAGYDAL